MILLLVIGHIYRNPTGALARSYQKLLAAVRRTLLS
jgi:hypothetical protein